MTASRAYLRRLAAVFALGLSLLIATNVFVDPFAALDRVRIPGVNAEKLYAHLVAIRVDKSIRLALDRFEVLIFGSSRVAIALDPEDPVFAGRRVYNAALFATSFEELETVVSYALDRQQPDEIFLGIDFFMVSGTRPLGPDHHASAFSGRHPAEVLAKRMSSWDLFGKSLMTVAGNLAGQSGILGRNGFVRGPIGFDGPWNPRHRFNHMLTQFAESADTYGCFRWSQERMAAFGRVLARIRRSGAETHVFLPPIHAEQQELIHALGLGADYERFKREATAAVAAAGAPLSLWDFTGYAPENTERVPRGEGQMEGYWESSHAKTTLGAAMVTRMRGPGAAGPGAFGVRLEPENVSAQLAAQRARRVAWLARARGAGEGIRRLAQRAAPAREAACRAHARRAPGPAARTIF